MKRVYVRCSAKEFIDAHHLEIRHNIMGVYVPDEETSYIFLDEIRKEAILLWLVSKVDTFKGGNGRQRLFVRLRRLVEYHEYGHYLQHTKNRLSADESITDHNEHVADRYATMRYLRDYKRLPQLKFSRDKITKGGNK